jgi:hypothetical protein
MSLASIIPHFNKNKKQTLFYYKNKIKGLVLLCIVQLC